MITVVWLTQREPPVRQFRFLAQTPAEMPGTHHRAPKCDGARFREPVSHVPEVNAEGRMRITDAHALHCRCALRERALGRVGEARDGDAGSKSHQVPRPVTCGWYFA